MTGHVTFPAVGRCGNFLMECACALAYALKHDLKFTVPNWTTDNFWSKLYLQHLYDPSFNPSLDKIELWESGHEYEEIPFKEEWRGKNIIIHGYRQSWKYWDDYRSELLYLFDIPYTFKPNHVSVHVRRTDYILLPDKHPQIGIEWYEKAMDLFPADSIFEIYTDDHRWCVENFKHRDNVRFMTGDEMLDLANASSCEHNIISSSTFGWWMGYLNRNKNKKVIIPSLWFVENYHLSTKDIVPSDFMKLPL